jgi:hypothetical protein
MEANTSRRRSSIGQHEGGRTENLPLNKSDFADDMGAMSHARRRMQEMKQIAATTSPRPPSAAGLQSRLQSFGGHSIFQRAEPADHGRFLLLASPERAVGRIWVFGSLQNPNPTPLAFSSSSSLQATRSIPVFRHATPPYRIVVTIVANFEAGRVHLPRSLTHPPATVPTRRPGGLGGGTSPPVHPIRSPMPPLCLCLTSIYRESSAPERMVASCEPMRYRRDHRSIHTCSMAAPSS